MPTDIIPTLVSTFTEAIPPHGNAFHNGRKRKRDLEVQEGAPEQYFNTIGLGQARKDVEFTLTPVIGVPKACMSLTWLELQSIGAGPAPGYLFQSTVKNIDNWDTQNLICGLYPSGGLFAVERVDQNTYISFPLRDWVTKEHCQSVARGDASVVDIQVLLRGQEKRDVRSRRTLSISSNVAPPTTSISPKKATNRKGAIARMSILNQKEIVEPSRTESPVLSTIADVEPDFTQDDSVQPENPPGTEIVEILPSDAATSNMTDSTIMKPESLTTDQLRQHYLNTLYLSKTSLAFFAKGPLSRARGQATSGEVDFQVDDLIEFYNQSILPAKKMDIKFKESVSKVIQSLPTLQTDDGEKSKKRKSTKKSKLGKDCLWPSEPEFIEKWWRSREFKTGMTSSDYSQSEELRTSISDIRMRETEMQLLLLLELLLLESLPPKEPHTLDVHPQSDIKVESLEEDIPTVLAKTPKAKKPRNISAEIDAIVDRLCIWHTVGIDDIFASPEKTKNDSTEPRSQSKDRLRDFCADVIIPFYASKLPDRCKSICRKLGGPEISPQRPKAKHSKPSHSVRPNAGHSKLKSRPVEKRTLERVLSEDQFTRHASPPVLLRSTTAPLGLNLKREPSEPPRRPMSRGGLHKSVSFNNREVDLVADAKAQAMKRRKLEALAKQKHDLDAAIDALRKPNRVHAAGTFMDDIERRGVDKKTGLKKAEQIVQITATPKKGKSRSMVEDDVELPPMPRICLPDENPIIPSSTVKLRDHNPSSSAPRSSAMKRAVLSAIHDTPSRRQSRISNQAIFHSPSTNRFTETNVEDGSTSIIAATPAKPISRLNLPSSAEATTPLRMTKSQKPVLFTPLKKDLVRMEDAFRDAPEIPEDVGKAMDRVMGSKGAGDDLNIYDRLGWNDDFDL